MIIYQNIDIQRSVKTSQWSKNLKTGINEAYGNNSENKNLRNQTAMIR